ncbi:alpha/beta hydrolase family protein [Edaphocola aurantiacus]|uniref:alpha/beta hydrolase family protein n=1 Tax=Edaphocola aurantiacus TaxID=2601682 RepID=UPI001C976235|nr:lipase family protein [Edaphocola aurantiacus]
MKAALPLLMLCCTLLFGACTKNHTPNDTQARGSLISSTKIGHLTAAEIAAHADKFNAQPMVSHGVTYHSITYRTVYKGQPIDSRGLLLIPDNADTTYLLAYFHGTHLPINLGEFYQSKFESPSNYDGRSTGFLETRNIALIWASAGYTVFLPDYIGFGATSDKEHPYLMYPEMFKCNIDGLLAAKKFIQNQGTVYDNRIFLSGWSQGGGACLSAHKYIQEQYASDFTVTASSGLAGPYNFKGFIDTILSKRNDELNIINIFSWGVYSLNKFSDKLQRPTDQIFSYPVYDQYAAIFPPSKTPSKVLNEYFLKRIMDGTDTKFVQVMEENTYDHGWKPVGKVFLHHGEADNVVYYFNSTDARDGLTAAGGDVTLHSYPGGTHDSELENYVRNTLTDFNALK